MADSSPCHTDTVDSCPTQAAADRNLRHHLVRLRKRRRCHSLRRCCNRQCKPGNGNQSEHCYPPIDLTTCNTTQTRRLDVEIDQGSHSDGALIFWRNPRRSLTQAWDDTRRLQPLFEHTDATTLYRFLGRLNWFFRTARRQFVQICRLQHEIFKHWRGVFDPVASETVERRSFAVIK